MSEAVCRSLVYINVVAIFAMFGWVNRVYVLIDAIMTLFLESLDRESYILGSYRASVKSTTILQKPLQDVFGK